MPNKDFAIHVKMMPEFQKNSVHIKNPARVEIICGLPKAKLKEIVAESDVMLKEGYEIFLDKLKTQLLSLIPIFSWY
ncbi:hypothetical protein MC885_003099, partial [Smutsia gigantea]